MFVVIVLISDESKPNKKVPAVSVVAFGFFIFHRITHKKESLCGQCQSSCIIPIFVTYESLRRMARPRKDTPFSSREKGIGSHISELIAAHPEYPGRLLSPKATNVRPQWQQIRAGKIHVRKTQRMGHDDSKREAHTAKTLK